MEVAGYGARWLRGSLTTLAMELAGYGTRWLWSSLAMELAGYVAR